MSLPPGSRLGPYEILAPLGAGGMGEVYRARDPRLGREVALKLLPAAMADDPAARARLVREARLAATLNHPHICTVYDVGEADGRVYLALELIEGQPLAALVANRPAGLATEQVVGYGAQVADALAHAHERHVIHRDLKAANVMVTRDGRVKVLDFGVARRMQAAEVDAATIALTQPGAVVGTPQYLAPEVLDGREADERSDLWALGVLLFEMASGTPPFTGATSFALASAILHDPPAPLPERVPPGLRGVIARCLAKAPGERYQRASEVRAALGAVAGHAAPASMPAPGARPPGWRRPALVGTGLAVAAVVFLLARHPAPSPVDLKQRQLVSSSIEEADEAVTGAISPDGKTVAVVGLSHLSLRSVDSGESHPVELPPGFGFLSPFPYVVWYPDGSALLASGRMGDGHAAVWALPVAGGRMRKVLDGALFATVSPDGSHIAYLRQDAHRGEEIWVSDANGDAARRVTGDDSTGILPAWATWSPNGRRLAYARYNPAWRGESPRLESCDLSGRARVAYAPPSDRVLHYNTVPAWLRDGRMIFGLTDPPPNARDVNLWSLRVDPTSGAPTGEPRRITQWQRLALVLPTGCSADGKRLTVSAIEYQSDVYVARLGAAGAPLEGVRRLTLDERMDLGPAWMPDDSSLVFASNRNGTNDIFRQRISATDPEPLVTGPGEQYAPHPTPDGAWILYAEDASAPQASTTVSAGTHLMRVPAAGGRAEKVLDFRGIGGYRVPRTLGALSVLFELLPGTRVWSAFDPLHGRGRELLRLPGNGVPAWDVSPDGTTLAIVAVGQDSLPRIRLFSALGGAGSDATRAATPTREIRLDRRAQIDELAYAPDGRSWTAIESGDAYFLLRIDGSGRTARLLPPQLWMYSAQIAPDGKQIAYTSNRGQVGLWLLEDF